MHSWIFKKSPFIRFLKFLKNKVIIIIRENPGLQPFCDFASKTANLDKKNLNFSEFSLDVGFDDQSWKYQYLL